MFHIIRSKSQTFLCKTFCRSPKHLFHVQAALPMQKVSRGSTLGRASFLVPHAVEKMAVRGHKHLQAAMPMEKVSKGELLMYKTAITVATMFYPLYVIFNIENFKKEYNESR